MKQIELTANLGELKYGIKEEVLVCYGLGSCVGVALYDSKTQIGGIAHVVLPSDSNYHSNMEQAEVYLSSLSNSSNPSKFADSGLMVLTRDLIKRGVDRSNLKAKIAGGASVLAPIFLNSNELDIGKRNIEAVEKALADLNIPIIGKDVGGKKGRTMRFYLNDGTVEISTFGLAKIIL